MKAAENWLRKAWNGPDVSLPCPKDALPVGEWCEYRAFVKREENGEVLLAKVRLEKKNPEVIDD